MIKKYYKQTYANYFENFDEIKTFLETHKLSKLLKITQKA